MVEANGDLASEIGVNNRKSKGVRSPFFPIAATRPSGGGKGVREVLQPPHEVRQLPVAVAGAFSSPAGAGRAEKAPDLFIPCGIVRALYERWLSATGSDI